MLACPKIARCINRLARGRGFVDECRSFSFVEVLAMIYELRVHQPVPGQMP
jgi:hypothetical protein